MDGHAVNHSIDPQLLTTKPAVPDFSALPPESQELLSGYNWQTSDLNHLCAAVLVAQAAYASQYGGSVHFDTGRHIDDLIYRVLRSPQPPFPESVQSEDNKIDLFDFDALLKDDSDIDDDEADSLFPGLRALLSAFKEPSRRLFLVVRPLNSRQRRHVHAVAQMLQFGHMTVGTTGVCRMMLISRIPSDLARSVKDTYKNARHPPFLCEGPITAEPDSQEVLDWGDTADGSFDMLGSYAAAYDTSNYSSASQDSAHSNFSNFSVASNGRKRLKRHAGAYFCLELGCDARFDRQCDLSHHERTHLPYCQRPYKCESCHRRFLFPKDLRRHEKTHHDASITTQA